MVYAYTHYINTVQDINHVQDMKSKHSKFAVDKSTVSSRGQSYKSKVCSSVNHVSISKREKIEEKEREMTIYCECVI